MDCFVAKLLAMTRTVAIVRNTVTKSAVIARNAMTRTVFIARNAVTKSAVIVRNTVTKSAVIARNAVTRQSISCSSCRKPSCCVSEQKLSLKMEHLLSGGVQHKQQEKDIRKHLLQ